MYDRLLNFLLFKVVFIGAVLEPTWIQLLILATWFGVLGYLRIFSMLCRDRFEHVSSKLFIANGLYMHDMTTINHARIILARFLSLSPSHSYRSQRTFRQRLM